MNEPSKQERVAADQRAETRPDVGEGTRAEAGPENVIASQVLWDSSLATSRLDQEIAVPPAENDESAGKAETPVSKAEKSGSAEEKDVPVHEDHKDAEADHHERESRSPADRARDLRRPNVNH
ncbi:hypothetical protein [Sphaerisporangium corydalis]|uniref:Uncharacterized protein n=1 Tax=Sphaerisporangium corydalis TaxID=1441875 RepID=A0ABV9EJ70_9ACTN|nr:hypothetical protein [Sphaerisporangium corydalis]